MSSKTKVKWLLERRDIERELKSKTLFQGKIEVGINKWKIQSKQLLILLDKENLINIVWVCGSYVLDYFSRMILLFVIYLLVSMVVYLDAISSNGAEDLL